jgi:diguanylate cyclase (GGDEF)-like protein/PAS domain S-box-containing protein
MRPETATLLRQRSLGILFVVSDAGSVELCLQQLERTQFRPKADIVLTWAECTEKLRSRSYDLVVAEYPNSSWRGPRDLKALHRAVQEVPLLFLVTASGRESIAELTAHGEFEHLERTHVKQLPMAVRRILNERRLRIELEAAEKALQRSQSQYRALANNPAFGVLRCDADGKFLDVNDALVAMLGYASKEELLRASRSSEIVLDPKLAMTFGSPSPEKNRIDPVEVVWERKNGMILRAKLSGRGVYGQGGHFMRNEIIIVDITEQRELENRLRREASSDPLTELANRRSLFESLHAEICRCHRTKREFSFVLLDLDGLKEINDRFGHLVGDRALCRIARILADCSRSVDTLARLGGDEFAVLLPETDAASAEVVARRICLQLANDAEQPALCVSFGIAGFPADGDTIATLIHAADMTLYAMKGQRTTMVRAGRVC